MYNPNLTFRERCVIHAAEQILADNNAPYKYHSMFGDLEELWYTSEHKGPVSSPYSKNKEVWIYTRHQCYDINTRDDNNIGLYRYKVGRSSKLSPELKIDTPNIEVGYSLAANMFTMEQALTAVANLNVTLGEVIYLITTDVEAARVVAGDITIEESTYLEDEQTMCHKILEAIHDMSKALPPPIYPLWESGEFWKND